MDQEGGIGLVTGRLHIGGSMKRGQMNRGKHLPYLETVWGHPDKDLCPFCGKDYRNTALVDVVYAFEPCRCSKADYEHLVETTYHRDCFMAANPYPYPPSENPKADRDCGSTEAPERRA